MGSRLEEDLRFLRMQRETKSAAPARLVQIGCLQRCVVFKRYDKFVARRSSYRVLDH